MSVLIVFFLLPNLVALIDLFYYVVRKKRMISSTFIILLEYGGVLLLPLLFLFMQGVSQNDCCDNLTAAISPKHFLTFFVFIAWFLYSFFRLRNHMKPMSPLMYAFLISGVCVGIVLNVFIMIQFPVGVVVNPAIIFFSLTLLLRKQREFISDKNSGLMRIKEGKLSRLFEVVYNLPIVTSIPVLFLLSIPVAALLMGLLILFGQEPDALIRAFTDTYRHTFSALDYECANVHCGDHYLCSVAANGHEKIVKPQRYGRRNGAWITCNRQLLISNAFEQLIEEKAPKLHRIIRRNYNHVGRFIHRYYGIFNVRFVSDIVYVLMKPFEWCFLITLYLFDKQPENRIHLQYIDKEQFARFQKSKC
jgi:hypothetical protein